MSKILDEICKTLGITLRPRDKEARSDFLNRVSRIADKTIEEDPEKWDLLSDPTCAWLNDAAKSAKARKAIKEFPDYDPDEEVPAKPVKSKQAPAKITTSKKPPKPAPNKPRSRVDEEDEESVRKTKRRDNGEMNKGIEYRVKMLMIKDPTITVDELIGKLSAGGKKVSRFTIVAMRTGFKHSCRVLKEAGWPKVNFDRSSA